MLALAARVGFVFFSDTTICRASTVPRERGRAFVFFSRLLDETRPVERMFSSINEKGNHPSLFPFIIANYRLRSIFTDTGVFFNYFLPCNLPLDLQNSLSVSHCRRRDAQILKLFSLFAIHLAPKTTVPPLSAVGRLYLCTLAPKERIK